MQIVIPMSGFGERFRRAGFLVPKPLIDVDGIPMIAHVVNLFPGEKDFIFICNEEHLANKEFRMKEVINQFCPSGRIIGIPPHKLGPIHAIRQVEHLLNPNKPVVVNYCDFSCYWNWNHFKYFIASSKCDGAIPAYRGFHPHSLGNTNYAYIKESQGWITDIQEKQPYTNDRMNEFASSGTYYFSSAKLMGDCFNEVLRKNLNVGGEFYVSLAYKPLLGWEKKIAVYPLQHFMQWGTPEDLSEYQSWSRAFRGMLGPKLNQKANGSIVVPMAGLGQRFQDEEYEDPKPLISVSGREMAVQAIQGLPNSKYQSFVIRREMPKIGRLAASLKNSFPNSILSEVSGVTEGQACTAILGLNALTNCSLNNDAKLALHENHEVEPITFGACDGSVLFNLHSYLALLKNPEIDVIVWGVRGHVNAVRHPKMFGWIDADANRRIQHVSVKEPLESLSKDPIVIGIFTFKKVDDARRAIEALIARKGLVNGEYYLDSCINDAIDLGLGCYLFEVDSFISWGTPNELKTFEYWQSCFHKWPYHPYRLEDDFRVNLDELDSICSKFTEPLPSLQGE